MHDLTLQIEVQGEAATCTARKSRIASLADVILDVTDFLGEFGHPTKGPQIITITVKSSP